MATTPTARRGMGGALALLLAPLLGSLACEDEPGPPDEPSPASLVELDRWEWVEDAADDVFGAERPAGLVCDPVLGIGEEMLGSDRVLEIKTAFCDYATVRQPSLVALAAGDTVSIRMFHWDLTTPAPAEAHLALAIDGRIAWEEHVPSPAAGAIVEGELDIEREVPIGAELQLHVHNHGANSYDLVSLELASNGERSEP